MSHFDDLSPNNYFDLGHDAFDALNVLGPDALVAQCGSAINEGMRKVAARIGLDRNAGYLPFATQSTV